MIDISVTGLIKSFDLEKKILDGITFQIDTGERVGLLGKNGAGKTTLFRILTGELDYDAGEVSIASGRRLGLISQIPVYPEGYTVEDVLKSAFSRMQRMEDEMNALSQQMANGDESEETLRRYGELSAKFEGLGGYDTETPINKVANGLSIPPRLARFGHDLARDGFGARDERERAFNRKQADKPQCDHTPEKRHDPLRRFFEDNPQHEHRQNEPACADAEVHELQKDVIHDDSPFDKGRSFSAPRRVPCRSRGSTW